jgi:hypothetical protein
MSTLGVVRVHADVRREEVAREVGAAQAAHAGLLVGAEEAVFRIGEAVARGDAGDVAAHAGRFGPRGVDEDVLGVRRAGVGHELGVHHRDGGADVT